MKVQNHVIMVTGGGKGIGCELFLSLLVKWNKYSLALFGVILLLFILVGCSTPNSILTPETTQEITGFENSVENPTAVPIPIFILTIRENECTLDSPAAIPFGQFEVILIIDERENSETGYAILALDSGKTLADLQAWTFVYQPDWSDRLAGEHQMVSGTTSRIIDLGPMAAMQDRGEIYFVCFHTDPQTHVRQNLGSFGPIEIER